VSKIVYLSDPEVTSLPVDESGDRLVDLRDIPALRVDTRLADPDGHFAHVRCDVANRLVIAQTLLPTGLGLLVVEGYRPMALQRKYFDAHVGRLRRAHPQRDEAWLRARASRYISPPEVAPHVSGGAVDLTLCDRTGRELPLGTEVNATPEESAGACRTDAPGIGAEAREHRALLRRVLTATGFVNYPTEWWHWSYGDRYWAFVTRAVAATYGVARRA
jgi:zinc D-Ala-D-Ala dipeptidase